MSPHMANDRVDELIDMIRSEVDTDKRMEYYAELQQVFHDEGTVINLQVPYLVGLSDSVVDYRQPLTMLPQLEYATVK